MKYLSEKDLLVQKIDEILARELPTSSESDPEIVRLITARQVLLGEMTATDSTGFSASSGSAEVGPSYQQNLVDEFARVAQFLDSLKRELDLRKAFLGLIEVVSFILTVVVALSAQEANRNSQRKAS